MKKINTFDLLSNNKLIHVKIDPVFRESIKKQLIFKYKSLKNYFIYCKLNIAYTTLVHECNLNEYFNFFRLLKIAKDLNIPKQEVYNHISVFIARGSTTKKEIFLQQEFNIDELFVEGFALYLAEGDNGSNGNTKPRKVRFTNSELVVIKQFMLWIQKYFPHNKFYLKIRFPHYKELSVEFIEHIKKYLNLSKNQIKIKKEHFKNRSGIIFRICADSAVLIDLILEMEETIKSLVAKDKKLMCAYIRGMMIGEGTAYCNKMKYVRIEMRNEKEIKFLKKLFNRLGFDVKAKERGTRKSMWYIYIGTPLLKKYNELIGFGIHNKRQKILEKCIAAMEKKLKSRLHK